MDEREILLRRVGLKCSDFVRQLSYHNALSCYRPFKHNFWIYMFNNTISMAILDWSHLFGNHDDDLHWKKIVDHVEDFRQGLLRSINMTDYEWKTYRKTIKEYRDEDVAHIEVKPISKVPQMAHALQATTYYYSLVLEELSCIRDYSKWPRNLDDYFQKSLEQAKLLVSIAYTATKGEEEKVY
jgi:hypothetical protein